MPDFPSLCPHCADLAAIGLQASTVPTQVACGNNAKTTYTELIASTAHDYDWIAAYVLQGAGATNWNQGLVDIAIGASSAEKVIIENLGFVWNGTNAAMGQQPYQFPIKIKAGTRISANGAKSNSAGINPYVELILGTGSFLGTAAAFPTIVVGLGADVSASKGTPVDAGATASTKGAWSVISASVPGDIWELNMWVGPNLNTGLSAAWFRFDIGIGASGQEQVIVPDILVRTSASTSMYHMIHKFPMFVAAGSRLVVRCESTTTNVTDRVLDCIIYALSHGVDA